MLEEKIKHKIENTFEIIEETLKYELEALNECLSKIDTLHYLMYLENDIKNTEDNDNT